MYRALLEAERPGPLRPSLQDLALDDRGRLWVQVVDERYRDLWPYMAALAPETTPALVPWDVFSPEGELLRRVEVPRGFRVRVFGDDALVGFRELPGGEVVIARAWLRHAE